MIFEKIDLNRNVQVSVFLEKRDQLSRYEKIGADICCTYVRKNEEISLRYVHFCKVT